MKKIIVMFSVAILSATTLFAQKTMKPEETETWENEPPVVVPDGNYGAPSDAFLLLQDGLSEWESEKGSEAGWTYENGIITVKPGAGVIQTKKGFGSMQLHIEWRSPEVLDPSKTGQARGNSGIFLQSRYEVQVLDSYKSRTYSNGQAASIYKQHIPQANATTPPGTWQTYDIIYDAPEFDKKGKLVKPAYVTVIHNGVLALNHVEIKGSTEYIGIPEYKAHDEKMPLVLQDHGNLVSYRNIWIREL
ncbi:MAG: DUF1080 domain-containing protein [Cyclobacteriaceae bacterium]|nr:DUF1080 domain-containing protein [Cyclobacteriaceae bacterium]